MNNYKYWNDKLASQELTEFTTNPEAMLWLKIHSIAKTDVMKGFLSSKADFIKSKRVELISKKVEDKAVEIFTKIDEGSIDDWNTALDDYFRKENDKQYKTLDVKTLESDLCCIQHFKWGGDQNNSLDKYFVSHYVKSIKSYHEIDEKLNNEALSVVRNYVLSSWYNHWSSIVIEHIFKQHKKVLPTVGQVKSIDFIIQGIPFDLKVTYLPNGDWYQRGVKSHLEGEGLDKTEIACLKRFAKKAKIKYNTKLTINEQHFQIRKMLETNAPDLFNEAMMNLDKIRTAKIKYARENASLLAKLLYENQGPIRFGSENRIYLVLIDKDDMENSWEMKRDFPRLKSAINSYLDSFDARNLNKMKLTFDYSGKQYVTHADTIFVVKE